MEVTQPFEMEVSSSTFSHDFGISNILCLITVTGDIPKEPLLEKKAIEMCAVVYMRAD